METFRPLVTRNPGAALVEALRNVLVQVAEPTHVLRTILEQAVTQTAASRGVLVEVTQGSDLEFNILHQYRRDDLTMRDHYSRSIFDWVLQSGQGVLLENILEDPRFRTAVSVIRLRLSAILCMPIKSGNRVMALVYLEHDQSGHFGAAHRELLRGLVEVAEPLLEALQASRETLLAQRALETSEAGLRQETQESRGLLARDWSFGRFIGRSSAVRELEGELRKAAQTDFPVLLLGETGTGKSILARVVHYAGSRSSQAFVTVFCPSLERSMVEAELFGHRKGAFTGALTDRVGKIQVAEKGTLFLDEIGELPLEIQSKLLRLLQEKTYERVGDADERRADVRVIAATNRDLEEEVRHGRFRRDLFERLNFLPIRVPALRERAADIPLLLRHALDQSEIGRWIEISDDAMNYLRGLDFSWPGNVRHIEQLAARLILEGRGVTITCDRLKRHLGPAMEAESRLRSTEPPDAVPPDLAPTANPPEFDFEAGLSALMRDSERQWLLAALQRYPKLTRVELAGKLKISESSLYKKLREYHLD